MTSICWTTGGQGESTERHSKCHTINPDNPSKTMCGVSIPEYCDNFADDGLCKRCDKIKEAREAREDDPQVIAPVIEDDEDDDEGFLLVWKD